MASISNVVAFDGAATPVSHTFIPVSVSREGKDKIRADYREVFSGAPANAQPRLSITLERLKSGIYRTERRLVVPVMESVSGQNSSGYTAAPKIAHELTDVRIGFYSERSDFAGRRLVRQLGCNIDGNIATSVAPVTTGPIPELIDLLIVPT